MGDYTGGELVIYDEESEVRMEVAEPIRGANWVKPGTSIPVQILDIRNRLVEFDGTLPHMVKSFEGTRFTVVFFTHSSWRRAKATTMRELKAYGFPLPTDTQRIGHQG